MEAGFYPGGGGLDDIGSLTGTGYAANVPLRGAYSDETLCYVFVKYVSCMFHINKTVFTLSFHKEAGFYPGGGGLDDIGSLCNICACIIFSGYLSQFTSTSSPKR